MASRKDYVATAAVIRRVKNRKEKGRLVLQFEKIFKADNPRFDTSKFRTACGYTYKQRKSGVASKWGFFDSMRDILTLKDI
jgi:hypothetical protein